MPLTKLTPIVLTLFISVLGGAIATFLHLPAGWLMGGALAVTIAAMAGVPVTMHPRVRDVTFVLIGMSMGASVAPDSLSLLASWPISLLGLAIELVVIITLTGWMLTRLFKLDAGTAYLSSFPGHLSFVMSIASAGVGDARQIVIIQVIRSRSRVVGHRFFSVFRVRGTSRCQRIILFRCDVPGRNVTYILLACFV